MKELIKLSELIKDRNNIGAKISNVINRPAMIGHTGEYIASKIFNIHLEKSAVTKSIDGYFIDAPLKNRSVNIKWYAKQESLLDITPDFLPDFYLVMTGPKSQAMSSKGAIRPWLIEKVCLFNAKNLVESLKRNNVKIGVATSVKNIYWQEAEIYPIPKNKTYILNKEQIKLLQLFNNN